MENNNFLIIIYVIGGIIAAVGLSFLAFLYLQAYLKRRGELNKNGGRPEVHPTTDLALGMFCAFAFLRVSLEVLSIWYNYAWLVSVTTLLWGCVSFWLVIYAVQTIRQRTYINECLNIRKEKEELAQIVEQANNILNKGASE